MRFAIFPVHLSKLLRLPRKSDARSYEVLHLSRKIISANLKIDLMLQNAAPLRKSAPGPPNSSDEHVSCTAPATENASLHASSNVPRLPSFLEMPQNPHVLLTFDKVHNPLRLPRETTSERPKVVQPPGVFFHILTSKCASHHNGVHFFDISTSKSGASHHNGVHFFNISTSKSGPNMVRFVHFDFETCFAAQRRALFRHLNSKSGPSMWSFCTFWLGNVLRATTACNFSSLIWPDGFAPAALAGLLFDPPEPQITRKTQCFATFLPFRAPASSLFCSSLFYSLFSLTLPISAFHLSISAEVWLLNFLRQLQPLHHTTSSSCGKMTTATIATIPKNTTPTTCRSISGFTLPSVIHNNQPLL